jgi:hypothetical protein
MLKVMLMIDCDACRRLFRLSHVASEDRTAWLIHGGSLTDMAEEEGWGNSSCRNFHYCPRCVEEDVTRLF